MRLLPGMNLQAVLTVEFRGLPPAAICRVHADEAEAIRGRVVQAFKPAARALWNEGRSWRAAVPRLQAAGACRCFLFPLLVSKIAHFTPRPDVTLRTKVEQIRK